MKRRTITALMLTLAVSVFFVPVTGESVTVAEWSVENAAEVFENSILIPANAAQYRRELVAQLTEEQANAFQEGMVSIVVPNVKAGENEEGIQCICCLPAELTDDHQLKADFSGLYVSVEEKESENLQAQLS